ncbi:MAG: PD-(D/E)XK nuclease family protein [Bacteroidales bacterium]
MKSFLDQIANHLINNYGDDLGNIAIVLPSQRGGVFLKKYIANRIKKISLSPKIVGISNFAEELTGIKPADRLKLPFELYKIHRQIAGENKQNLETFLTWGEQLIREFSELDQYLVDVNKVFSHLSDSYAMNEWNVDGSPLTEFQQNYLKFYRSLGTYYNLLRDDQLNKKQAWSGLSYRILAENIETLAQKIKWKKIIFAGFNALTNAENKFIKHLVKIGLAEIFWDGDEYYFYKNGKGNTDIEAGLFLRRYAKSDFFNPMNFIGENYKNIAKNIQVVGVPKNIGQVKFASEVINKLKINKGIITNTALILAKESLLLPCINSMPDNIENYNITMGFPLTQIPIYDLFEFIFDLQINAKRLNLTSTKDRLFYTKDLIEIFSHPIFKTIEEYHQNTNKEPISSFEYQIQKIQYSSKIFFKKSELQIHKQKEDNHLNLFLDLILNDWNSEPIKAIQNLKLICKYVLPILTENGKDCLPPQEYLFIFHQIFLRIEETINEYQDLITINSIKKIFSNLSKTQSLPFYGEPLKGIQVMGVLETRTLDFDNIILLSANEGILPKGKNQNAFVPDEIKLSFGLPTYKEKNAVYAYHFYRLLQRAKNVYLVYNTETETMGGGQKSRFINQLLMELKNYNPKTTIEEKILTVPLNKSDKNTSDKKINIKKSKKIISLLQKKAKSGFSPSSLIQYINCSLQFYFAQILNLEEEKEIEENIDAAALGTVVHKILENFYTDFQGKTLSGVELSLLLPKINKQSIDAFNRESSTQNILYGKNRLIIEVGRQFVENFIRFEIEKLKQYKKQNKESILYSLEKFISTEFTLTNSNQEIKLKGFIDRIDSVGDQIRIIDYKTGKVENKNLRFSDFEELFSKQELNKSFQLVMYTWLYHKCNPELNNHKILAGIYSFRSLSGGLLTAQKIIKRNTFENTFNYNDLNDFEELLLQKIEEIFDTNISFTQTTERKNCEFCSFKDICNR